VAPGFHHQLAPDGFLVALSSLWLEPPERDGNPRFPNPVARPPEMTPHAAPRRPHPLVEAHRSRILARLTRSADPPRAGSPPLVPERKQYLVKEAEDLYWNELAWEELTEEERVGGGPVTELVFPGFLAFVDGLLLDATRYRGSNGSGPHPDVIEEILRFLAERHATATSQLGQGADSENLVWARAMTAHLIDLVLYRLYGLSREEREELEARG
jgi:hypothetical protein